MRFKSPSNLHRLGRCPQPRVLSVVLLPVEASISVFLSSAWSLSGSTRFRNGCRGKRSGQCPLCSIGLRVTFALYAYAPTGHMNASGRVSGGGFGLRSPPRISVSRQSLLWTRSGKSRFLKGYVDARVDSRNGENLKTQTESGESGESEHFGEIIANSNRNNRGSEL